MIKLKSGDYTAIINPYRGGNCISLRNEKYNAVILREPKGKTNLDNPYLYGMPILYPVNRIENGFFVFEGRKYVYPINEKETNCFLHGVLHETAFQIQEKGTDFVKCAFEGMSLSLYHKLRIEISYKLSSESGFRQTVEITNLSDKNMPNFLGFHTTFNVPFLKNGNFEDVFLCADVGNEIERDKNYLPTGRFLPFDDVTKKIQSGKFNPFEKVVSRHYKIQNDGKIQLADVRKGIKLVYKTDKKFLYRLFYNGNANEYICLEPMSCEVNCQNKENNRKKAGFDYILPHASKTYVSEIYLEEMK